MSITDVDVQYVWWVSSLQYDSDHMLPSNGISELVLLIWKVKYKMYMVFKW